MKIRFYCYAISSGIGQHSIIRRSAMVVGAGMSTTYWYGQYLLSALILDFPEQHRQCANTVLEKIVSIERGEIGCAQWVGHRFRHVLGPSDVVFTHAVLPGNPDWPAWSCPTAQYREALKQWLSFLSSPRSLDSELVFSLP